MDDVKRPSSNFSEPTNSNEPETESRHDSSTYTPVSPGNRPINVTDYSSDRSSAFDTNSSHSNEPMPTSSFEQSPKHEEEPREPEEVSLSQEPVAEKEVNEQAPIYYSQGSKLEKQPEGSSTQNGAGLDLSSLSGDDAKDLGIARPSTEPVELPDSSHSMAKPKRKSKSTFIAVAILVALALIAGAGYAYMQSNKKDKTSSQAPATTPAATPQKSTDVKAADIDKTSTDIDTTLKKVDDTKNFADTDLADSSLGLQQIFSQFKETHIKLLKY